MSKKCVAECSHVGRPSSNATRADLRSGSLEGVANHVRVGKARDTGTSVIKSTGENCVWMSCLRTDDPRDLNTLQPLPEHTMAQEAFAGTERQFIGKVDDSSLPDGVV